MLEAPQVASSDGARDGPLPASPSFLLDLSGEGGLPERFLLGYTAGEGGSSSGVTLESLAIVVEGAVYSNGSASLQGFVDKPPARKNLSARDHLRKVRDALGAGASNVPGTAGGGRGVPLAGSDRTGAAAALPLKTTDDEAVLTVREAVKGGSSFVLLATVKLPVVQEAAGGLLLGAIRAAHRSAKEADRLRRDTERAAQERAKLKELLDTAINDKRKVLRKLLERAALVVNAKKAMIAQLQEQGSENESGGSARASEEEDGNASTGAGGDSGESDCGKGREEQAREKTDKTVGRGKGKGKEPLAEATDRAGTRGDGRKSRGRAAAREEGVIIDRNSAGVVVRVKAKPGLEGFGEGAFAVPAGTQEVSGEDLLLHVDGATASGARGSNKAAAAGGKGEENDDNSPTVKKELAERSCNNQRSSQRLNQRSNQRSNQRCKQSRSAMSQASLGRPPPPPLWQQKLATSDSDSNSDAEVGKACGGGSDGGGSGGGGSGGRGGDVDSGPGKNSIDEALKHIGGDSSGSDGDGGGFGGGRTELVSSPRRRRKRKKVAPAAAVEGSGGGRDYGASARTTAGGSSSAGIAAKPEIGSKKEKESKPKSIFDKMCEDDDSDIDDLQ